MWMNVHICIPYIDFSFLFPGLLLSLLHLLLLLQLLDWVNSFLALFSFLPPPPHPNPSLAHPPPVSPPSPPPSPPSPPLATPPLSKIA